VLITTGAVRKELVNNQTVNHTDLAPLGYDFLSGEDQTRDGNGLVRYMDKNPPPPRVHNQWNDDNRNRKTWSQHCRWS